MPDRLPLHGVRVLDLTQGTVGPFCTRALSDLGADVIKVEPPGGDPSRAMGPFLDDEPGPERSGLFAMLNTGKRSITLDVHAPDDLQRVLDLAATCQAVVENYGPGIADDLGLGYERLRERNPGIVLTSISDFGQDGPYRDWTGTDLTIWAMGGPMIGTGNIDHEPIRLAGRWAGYQAGLMASVATTIALRGAEQSGEGEWLDVSIYEALAHTIDFRLTWLQAYQYAGRLWPRASVAAGLGNGVTPCADGYVILSFGLPTQIPRAFAMLGISDWLERPEWQEPGVIANPERIEEFQQVLFPWTLSRTREEIRDELDKWGVLGAPLNAIHETIENPHFVEREFYQEIDHPVLGKQTYPGYHFKMHGVDGGVPNRSRAPLLGEHTDEVLAELGSQIGDQPAAPAPSSANGAQGRLPLEGVRILDFTLIWAGPYGTMHLSDFGAEVIRIESRQHFAYNTRGLIANVTRRMLAGQPALAGWYPDGDPEPDSWNRCANFTGHARGKKSVTLDISRPEGWAEFEKLVRSADGLIENNLPSNMEKLGVTWERLKEINPNLVLVRAPAFGLTGKYKEYRALGNHMEAVVGHPLLRGYPDLGIDYSPTGVHPDAISGISIALAFMAGLRFRDLNGHGLELEVATAENVIPFLGEFIMDYSMNGRVWEHMGNEHWWIAPHNVYQCAGGNRWVAIVAETAEQWENLCRTMLREDIIQDERFATAEARYANRRELDTLIGAWTAPLDAKWVAQRLQSVGVHAGLVANEADYFYDEHLRAREFFVPIDSPATGLQLHAARAWKASNTPWTIPRYPPRLGEDNEYVYRELLGFDDERYEEFVRLGHIGTDYDPNVR